MVRLIQKLLFVLRFRYVKKWQGKIRLIYYQCSGMKVGNKTFLPKLYVTWPHQVSIGNNCTLEHGIYFKFDGIWKEGPSIRIGNHVFIGSGCEFNIRNGIAIGNDCLVASGCRFIDHDHGTSLNKLMRLQENNGAEIIIEENVWIGCNAVVLKGVTIHSGSIVAAGAVVTKSIPANEIWGGVPARKINERINHENPVYMRLTGTGA